MPRKLKQVSLYEKRSGSGSEGWPHCLEFEFTEGRPLSVTLPEQREYSAVAEAVASINAALKVAA